MQEAYQFAAGTAVHVLQASTGRRPVLAAPDDCRLYRRLLGEGCRAHRLSLHAYALMPDRVHLLVTPARRCSIEALVASLRRDFHPRPRAGLGAPATLWQPQAGAVALETGERLLACYRQIERSPLQAGLVAQPGDYPWSSYRGNAEGAHDPLLTPHRVYLELAHYCREREAVYRRCVHGPGFAEHLADPAADPSADPSTDSSSDPAADPAACLTPASREQNFRRQLLQHLSAKPSRSGR